MGHRHPNHPGEIGTDRAMVERLRTPGELRVRARAIEVLTSAGIPFLVGGAYAYFQYTGIYRDTKDLDLFLTRADAERALEVLGRDGWRSERTFDWWLFKAFKGEWYVDLIFNSGNGVAEVDRSWFRNAPWGTVMGQRAL